MTQAGRTPTFSISIEWENARFAALERTRRMMRQLRQELIALPQPPHPPQINFLYDRLTIDGDLVGRVIGEEFRPDQVPATVRIIPTDGLRYYEQKNFGAARSSGEIVIFLDCDVVPESGWLAAMLSPFDDPAVDVVGGETYVELTGLCSKAFALFWFFGLRDDATDLRPATGVLFHTNNVAFRREIFSIHGFPDLSTHRVQHMVLGDTLQALGHGIFCQKRARAAHPYPETIGYFSARALHDGRDTVIVAGLRGGGNRIPWRSVYWNYKSGLTQSFRQIRRRRREVGLGRAGAVVAFSIAFAYLTLRTIGEAVTLARPNAISRLFPI